MNKAAQSLGKLGKGVPKTLTTKERKRRAVSLAVARAKRWPRKSNAPGERCAVAHMLDPVVRHSESKEDHHA